MSVTVDIVDLLIVTGSNRRVVPVLIARVVVMSFEVGCFSFFFFFLSYYNNIIVIMIVRW